MADRVVNAQQKFGYIVVGAGSAGCVLAARLNEDPNVRVALLGPLGPIAVGTPITRCPPHRSRRA